MDPVGIATDGTKLDQLRREAASDPKKAVTQAAHEFEALFTRQLLKSMRDAMPRSGMFEGPGQKTYESMLDDQLAREIAGQKGGLGEMLADHLARYMAPPGEPIVVDTSRQAADSNIPATSGLSHGAGGLAPVGAAEQSGLQVGRDPRIAMTGLPTALQQAISGPQSEREAETTDRRVEFVARLWPHARLAETATGVPAEFVIGQAALESGWGRGEMRYPDGRPAHNLFGIKAGSSWQGDTVDVPTTEYIDGKKTRSVETFRAYNSYAESFNDWVGLMKQLPRYADVLKSSQTSIQFASGLQAAGYATDPLYGQKLDRVIQQAIAIRRDNE